MPIARLDAQVATVACRLGEMENHGGHRQTDYGGTYRRIAETVRGPLVANVRKCSSHWSWEEVTSKESELYSK